jgi:hypothetical protein
MAIEWYVKFAFFGIFVILGTFYTLNYYTDSIKTYNASPMGDYKSPPLPNLGVLLFTLGSSGFFTTKYFYEKSKKL